MFKPGDRVVCVSNTAQEDVLIKGKTYTVKYCDKLFDNHDLRLVVLLEVKNSRGGSCWGVGFNSNRFLLAKEQHKDPFINYW